MAGTTASPNLRRMGRLARLHAPVLAVAAVYAWTSFGMPDGGLWINDNGLKLIQVEALLRSGFANFAIDWPGRSIDPGLAFMPITQGFFVLLDSELYASYSPVFALLSAPLYGLLGGAGLYLLPLLGAIAVLPAIRHLAIFAETGVAGGPVAESRSATPWIAVLVTGLATPLWFYSATFWEHAPAVALSSWSLVACLRFGAAPAIRTGVIAGVLLALPLYLRSDAYLLSAIIGVVAAWRAHDLRGTAWLGGAFALCLAPLWIFHLVLFGEPFGPHITSQAGGISAAAYLSERPTTIRNFLVNSHGSPWWSALAAAPFWLCVAAGGGLSQRGFRIGVPLAALGGLLAAAIVLQGHLTAPRPMNWLLASSGLFAAFPLAILALVRRATPADPAASVRSSLIFIVLADAVLLACLAPVINSTGIHWGNRFLLPLYPVLAVLASVSAVSWWRVCRPGSLRLVGCTTIAALLLASLLLQLHSISLLDKRRGFSRDLLERVVAAEADLVITDTWFLPMDLAPVFLDTPIFYASEARRPELLSRASRSGMRTLLVIDRLTPGRDQDLPVDAIRMRDDATRFSPVSLRTLTLDAAPTDSQALPRR